MKSLSTPPAAAMRPSRDLRQNERRLQHKKQSTALTFWIFVGPLILGLIAFFYIPIIWGFVLSFADARATVTPSKICWVAKLYYHAQ